MRRYIISGCIISGAVKGRGGCASPTRRVPVIQNDSRINFRSSQKPARFRYSRSSRNLLVREMSRGA